MSFEFVYVTAASPDQARDIGRRLVEERLAACVNIFDSMTSFYWWEGKIDQASEAVLIAKTRQDLVPKLVTRVKELHSYSVPCVVALPLSQGNPDFLAWIGRETRPA
jgi:periplasmic divalent cation tolerance protein